MAASPDPGTPLAERKCIPCRGDTPPLEKARIAELAGEIDGWSVVDDHHLVREFRFPDFQRTLDWVNAVGAVAETENHHPEITFTWGRARVKIWTHAIDGLSESDFVLAAKLDRVDR